MGTGLCLYDGGGVLLALRPTHPKKNLTQNLAEGKSNLNKRPLCGTHPDPLPPFGIHSLLTKPGVDTLQAASDSGMYFPHHCLICSLITMLPFPIYPPVNPLFPPVFPSCPVSLVFPTVAAHLQA